MRTQLHGLSAMRACAIVHVRKHGGVREASRYRSRMALVAAHTTLLLALVHVAAAIAPPSPSPPCPCDDPTLCAALPPGKAKVPLGSGREVLAFARSANYTGFDMSLVTTIAATEGPPPAEAVCFAHAHGARVVVLSDAEVDFGNSSARAALIRTLLNQTAGFGLDGVNLDIERFTATDPGGRDGLTAYVRELNSALKANSPPLQLSFDLSITPAGQTAGYNHKELAEHLDFIVPMAYDENWGRLTPEANSPIAAMATSLQQYANLGVLPSKLVVALPWYGTSWPCADPTKRAPCKTDLGKRTWSEVVSQPRVSEMVDRLGVHNTSAVTLDTQSMTQTFEWMDNRTAPGSKTNQRHIDMYDDETTIAAKVAALETASVALGGKLRGVAMWYAECIYGSASTPSMTVSEQAAMWAALVPPHNHDKAVSVEAGGQMVLELGGKAFRRWAATTPLDNNDWTGSTFMIGLMEYYKATVKAGVPDASALAHAKNWATAYGFQLKGPDRHPSHPPAKHIADHQLCGATYIELYKLDGNETHLADVRAVLGEEIAHSANTSNYWSWVDALFMAMSTFSRLGNITEDRNYRSVVTAKQWMNFNASALAPADAENRGVAEGHGKTFGFWNASDRLFYRDDSFIFSRVYWGRGNGWAIMALVAAIEHGGDVDPHRAAYLAIYRQLAAELLQVRTSYRVMPNAHRVGHGRRQLPLPSGLPC